MPDTPDTLTIDQIVRLAEMAITDLLEDMEGDLRRNGHATARIIYVSVDAGNLGVAIEVRP